MQRETRTQNPASQRVHEHNKKCQNYSLFESEVFERIPIMVASYANIRTCGETLAVDRFPL